MSKHVVALVYSRKAGSLLRKSVLAYMADVANHDGTGVWSSKQRIADEIEASKKGVKECIKGLVEDGILTEIGKRRCANGFTIEYAINLDVVASLEPMPHQKEEGGNSTPGTEVPLTGELGAPDGGTEVPQTVLNRPKPSNSDELDLGDKPSEQPKRRPPPRGAARGCRIPENWTPNPKDYAFASEQGLKREEINNEHAKFRDHWLSATGKGSTKRDWSAAWRNWIRNAVDWRAQRSARSSSGQNPAGKSSGGGLVAAGLRSIRETRGYGEQVSEEGRVGAHHGPDRKAG